ncbi:MAG TPA: phosphatidate cytidylyltransferase [Thermodesulfobacteriota bacterium]|nr:phosphatidate cytidylyltransferase [Thermodesulfobacteriota bacterium]
MGASLSSHFQRFLTAAVIIPFLFAYIVWGGPLLFAFLIWVGLLVGTYEYFHLTGAQRTWGEMGLHGVLGTITLVGAYFQGLEGLFGVLIFNFLVLVIYLVLTYQENGLFFDRLGKQLFALCYLPLFLPFFILLRGGPQGVHWIFFVLAVNYAGDTAAYYTGRAFGRHKLAPAVSPKKTREGSIGGLAANALMAWIFQQTLFMTVSAGELILLGLAVGILSQFGDLLESMLKRASGVKDSGTLFPGHGGVLDRVDSLLLPAPVVYFYLRTWNG